MTDMTREVGEAAQRGVRDANGWKFGPLVFATVETKDARCYSVLLYIGRISLQCGMTSMLSK